MLTTSSPGAVRPDVSTIEANHARSGQRLLRLAFNALAKQVSPGSVSVPSANSSATTQHAVRPDASSIEEKHTKRDQQLIRLAFNALAKQVSDGRASFPSKSSAKPQHSPHGTETSPQDMSVYG